MIVFIYYDPAAYLGFHFGGGVKNFSGKGGYLHGAKRHVARGFTDNVLLYVSLGVLQHILPRFLVTCAI